MRVDKTKALFVRPMARHPEGRQLRAAQPLGQMATYVVGKDGVASWRDMARQRRRGDTVYVEFLELLPDPKSDSGIPPSVDLVEALDEFARRGVLIVEIDTGHKTDSPDQLIIMRRTAVKALGAGGRSRPTAVARENGGKGGRPKAEFPEAVAQKAHMIWTGLKKYPTWRDAEAALEKLSKDEKLEHPFSSERCFKLWKGRGQLAKQKKRK
jgi:hypothetical protein